MGTAVQPEGVLMVGWVVFGERAVIDAIITSLRRVLPGVLRGIDVTELPALSSLLSVNAITACTAASALVSVPVAVNVSLAWPLTPIAPSRSSVFWVVAAVKPDDGEAVLPVPVWVRSRGVVERPENSFALSARRVAVGVVTEIVWPAEYALVTRTAKMTVRAFDAFVTSAATAYVPCEVSDTLTVPLAAVNATVRTTSFPTGIAEGTVTAIDVPLAALAFTPMFLTNVIAAAASDAENGTRSDRIRAVLRDDCRSAQAARRAVFTRPRGPTLSQMR